MEFSPIIDTYWRFAHERQQVYFKRLQDPYGPWTDDPIIDRYRFTNAYRAADRVSQYLIRHVQYDDARSQDVEEIFFRTLMFKIFNKIETWERLEREVGPLSWAHTSLSSMSDALDRMMSAGHTIYSAAYIMPAPRLGFVRKHANHLALVRLMMGDGLPAKIAKAATLRDVFEMLVPYPGLGRFLAFQYAIDLNYSSMLDFDESNFVIAGPGALDGIAKCCVDTGRLSAEDIIYAVTESQAAAFARLSLDFKGLGDRPLQPIDCQNLFCEISKYARVAHPTVAGVSGRTRIKQQYRPSSRATEQPFFPPRWQVELDITTFPAPAVNRQMSLSWTG
ncbi:MULTISPECIES: nucleotide kinase domain-containing protein [Sinorhizobium]|uniref:nucleotide kinase domain-containing protein n=1 Tax=Sinorhizobium TaxID=28105 RepID=UPI001304E9B0|nr:MULTISPECIES: nucleotide kinase domain-containing protein [Sinorhizobium]